ncbi:MAG: DUF2130 domain-containing protein [Crocinitomicaceae bacterium]|nr:DUF2130 domain-containing protein [Crocinitomicaceae bacterium]
MSESKVKCPNCGTEIDINDILTHQLEEELKKKYISEFAEKNKEVEKKKADLEKLKADFEENRRKENELFQERLEKKLKEERTELETKLKTKIREEQEDQLKLLTTELKEKSEQIKELNKSKAEIEKLKREKDELTDKIKAEQEKRLNEILLQEKEKIKKLAEEENKLKLLALQKQLDDQKKLTEDMKRKQEQGSMQLQGEVQELAIEDELSQLFPFDRVEEVSKGIRGADCIQTVVNKMQEECGKIIYESKRTQNFAGDWIPKLKSDMLAAGADVAVLVTQTLPKDQSTFTLVDGVWVCSFLEYKSLAVVLRDGLIKINATRASNENKGDKMQMLYSYLTGNEFRHQVEAIVEGFTSLKSELDREKRAMQRIWKDREKQIEKVIMNTIDLYGSVKGIAGSSVKTIESLDLDSNNLLEEGDDD